MFEIEYAEPEISVSELGKAKTCTLIRMITRDGSAYGICQIILREGQLPSDLIMTISLGEWWIDDSSFRRCFSLGFDPSSEHVGWSLIEPQATHGSDTQEWGRLLTRNQALADPEIDDLWRILDQLMEEDAVLQSYLQDGSLPPEPK